MSPVMNSVTETLASLLGTSCRRERVSWTYQQLECYLVMSSPGSDHRERFRLDLHTVGHHVLGDQLVPQDTGVTSCTARHETGEDEKARLTNGILSFLG